MNYCILLKYSSDEKRYIVTVPDLPGCMADGQTPSEAYENVKIVMGNGWRPLAQMVGRSRNQYLGEINFKGQLLPPLSV